jgi:hypothetical protein
MADKNKQSEYYSRPVKMGKWEGFKHFLWNGETSEVLGRTGSSWGKLKKFHFSSQGFFPFDDYVTYSTRSLALSRYGRDSR